MADDDERTPVDTPRSRRQSSVAYRATDLVAADVVAWVEQLLGMQLPPVPVPVRDRCAQRLAAAVRAGSGIERAEAERLQRALDGALAQVDTLKQRLEETQQALNRARNALIKE